MTLFDEPVESKQKSGCLWWIVFSSLIFIVGLLIFQPILNTRWGMILVQVPQTEGTNWYVVHGGGITHVADNVLRDRGFHWYKHVNMITFVTKVDELPSMASVHIDEMDYGPLALYEYPQADGAEVLVILSEQYDNSLPFQVEMTDGVKEIRWFS